jgi:hypothetical protein
MMMMMMMMTMTHPLHEVPLEIPIRGESVRPAAALAHGEVKHCSAEVLGHTRLLQSIIIIIMIIIFTIIIIIISS